MDILQIFNDLPTIQTFVLLAGKDGTTYLDIRCEHAGTTIFCACARFWGHTYSSLK